MGYALDGLKAWAELCIRFAARQFVPKIFQTLDRGLRLYIKLTADYCH
jgi:hypothetical protein